LEQKLVDLENKTGDLTKLSTTEKSNLVSSINELKTNIGNLTGLETETKADLVAAVNEISQKVTAHLADYLYQTPTIVGTQIQISQQSDSSRLYFKLDAALSGGNITISTDAGATELPLVDIDGVAITQLEKGFVEVVADATFFTLRNRGISGVDKQALIDIANEAEANDSDLKTQYINEVNAVDAYGGVSLPSDATWLGILAEIPNIKTGKKWAIGSSVIASSSTTFTTGDGTVKAWYYVNVAGLDFKPSSIIISSTSSNNISFVTILHPEVFEGTGDASNSRISLSQHRGYSSNDSVADARLEGNAIVNDGSFQLPVLGAGETYRWVAFE
jgi:hypothetical protein